MSSTETGYIHSTSFNIRTVQGKNRKVMNARVLFQRSRYDEDAQEYVDTGSVWADLSLWGSRAEALESVLKPGAAVLAAGTFYQRKWTHKETGEDQVGMGFRAEEVAILPRCIERIEYKARPNSGENGSAEESA
ncbi:MAG: single-stranded DNA-binding protein [Gammaproteobacteria bacterium]|nr:single-stranded DNA-binding protein [Gammaproteobacteria bacterium]